MTYDPRAPTARERSAAYFVVWIGLIASLVVVFATLFPFPERLRGLGAAILALEMIFALSARSDSYFRQLRDFGAVVALAIVTLWLVAQGLAEMGNASFAAGVAVGGSAARADPTGTVLPAVLNDTWLLAGLAAAGFHAGFLFVHLRGGR